MPSDLRRSPVVEADGRAPMERQVAALFFMLSVIGFRCLASRNWVPGGLTAALMTITRLNGVLMCRDIAA